jgi:hypothetical protein
MEGTYPLFNGQSGEFRREPKTTRRHSQSFARGFDPHLPHQVVFIFVSDVSYFWVRLCRETKLRPAWRAPAVLPGAVAPREVDFVLPTPLMQAPVRGSRSNAVLTRSSPGPHRCAPVPQGKIQFWGRSVVFISVAPIRKGALVLAPGASRCTTTEGPPFGGPSVRPPGRGSLPGASPFGITQGCRLASLR